ncbi:MAG: 50S ribosomal protein L17 [Verrucomicrobia bacterium]|nr:50S ribosomal protein L17 [Verrucomicrobiota bacterium]MCH8528515.1 50S ribosomal protein L17 [Kiritimatiellia bacterium]
MRHRKKTIKLGRDSAHRKAMLGNMVCSLINEKRITTTLPKARAARSLAEKMVTLGKRGDLHARRQAISRLRSQDSVYELFSTIAPAMSERQGGYTRIIKKGKRSSDASEMAILEWVDVTVAPAKEEAAVAE